MKIGTENSEAALLPPSPPPPPPPPLSLQTAGKINKETLQDRGMMFVLQLHSACTSQMLKQRY